MSFAMHMWNVKKVLFLDINSLKTEQRILDMQTYFKNLFKLNKNIFRNLRGNFGKQCVKFAGLLIVLRKFVQIKIVDRLSKVV